MFEPRPGRARRTDSTLDLARRTGVAPGRSTGLPGIVMKIDTTEGEAMAAAIEAAPGIAGADEEPAELPAVTAKRSPGPPPAEARSAYATRHDKVMRNYRFKTGTLITNTTDTEYRPNRSSKELRKLPGNERRTLLNTISVDIGTVIGGSKRDGYASGWVLVFKSTHIKRGGKKVKVPSGDHTGWIRVNRLAGDARKALAAHQRVVRRRLRQGKGAGHAAPLETKKRRFAVENRTTLWRDTAFMIQGGGGDTPLGNYTHRPGRYGDVIIGVWNPPGSGSAAGRFSGSGGIRAFFPLDQEFQLAKDAGAIEIQDTSGRGRSHWRYIGAELNGETIYCWLLERWQTRHGDKGHNFTL
jgi:hypothetical protein